MKFRESEVASCEQGSSDFGPLQTRLIACSFFFATNTITITTFTMPSAISPNARPGSSGMDDLNRLLDFDTALDDFMKDIPARNNNNNGNQNSAAQEQPRDEDQEVQVKKKRNPVPRLDESR